MYVRPGPHPVVRKRILVTAVLCAAAFGLVGARLADVMVLGGQGAQTAAAGRTVQKMRADLFDRNGVLIARDLPVSDLYASPASFWDTDEAAHTLAQATGADEERLKPLFAQKRGYVLVQRAVTPDMRDAVMALGLPGLTFENGFKRYYPGGRITAHAVGQVDADGNGVSGLELGLDRAIREAGEGHPVALSLDARVQYALTHEMDETMRTFRASAAGGLVMNVRTGEVLGMVSLPDYEPNLRAPGPGDSMRNRMTQDVYELGSIFKIFAFTQAIEDHAVRMDELIDVGTPLRFGRFSIEDFEHLGPLLPADQVFAHSSNIGTAKIALRSGGDRQRAFLLRLGLLTPLKTELPEIAGGLYPRRWGEVETATVSFGHGISVNPLAFAAAAASIVNGGTRITPTFVKRETPQDGERVISEETSIAMRRLLRLVVTDGTGGKADVPGYDVGGKTGTAEKPNGRTYARSQLISSFTGVFPMSDPEYLVFIIVDEPKGTKESYGFATGGWTAAPAVGRVIERIAPLLGVERTVALAGTEAGLRPN